MKKFRSYALASIIVLSIFAVSYIQLSSLHKTNTIATEDVIDPKPSFIQIKA